MTANLRKLVSSGKTLVVPGASDALSARLIEAHGFPCVYIGSYATAASRFGITDTGLLSLESLVDQARTIAKAVRIPVIADAEGGFEVEKTIPAFEQAGVAAIHIEDHTGAGKHTSAPQELRNMRDAADRIQAAVAARTNPDFLIVARSDAFWVHRDLEDCIARLQLYAAAGADLVFPTLVGGRELAEVRRRIAKPLMIVDNPGEQHEGAAVVLYYAFSITRQFAALQRALAEGRLASDAQPLEDFLGYKDIQGRDRS
ncbi:MAG TPA: isocitrate lyase/PEP mutase family protein [Burkholderiales bacterium]|nr:isocitrate lyase/PEP mutase family protein [Burkholderiales bacterium]